MNSLPVNVEGDAGVVELLKSIGLMNQLVDAPNSACLEGAILCANNPEVRTRDRLSDKSLIMIKPSGVS
jgi:hypothetical protein